MGISPQPPRPPMPPQPPRSSSNLVAIALLVLALIVLVSGIAVWAGVKFLSQNVRLQVQEKGSGNKEFSINTPVGSIQVHNEVNEDSLGLPLYPGATRVKDKDSAAVNLGFGDEHSVQVLAARFETPDSLETVKAFYKQRLGSEVTKIADHGPGGKTTFEIKAHNLEKVVALEGAGNRTLIQLVRVSFGKNESN